MNTNAANDPSPDEQPSLSRDRLFDNEQEVFDASFDRQVREAMDEVSIPEGLGRRLLLAVLDNPEQDGQVVDQSSQILVGRNSESEKDTSAVVNSRGRRRVLISLVAAASLAGLAFAFWPSTLSRQALTNLCLRNLEAFESQDEINEHRLPSYVLHYLTRSTVRRTQLSVSFDARPFGKSGKAWRLQTSLGPLYVLEFAKCANMTELNSRLTLINEPSESDGWSLLAFRTKSKIVVFATQSNIWELVEKPLMI